jgi:hypothetical protein
MAADILVMIGFAVWKVCSSTGRVLPSPERHERTYIDTQEWLALSPYQTLAASRHELAMLRNIPFNWGNEHDCAVQCANVTLNDANDEEHARLSSHGLHSCDRQRASLDLDSGLEVPQIFVPALRRSLANNSAKGGHLGITPDERLRKHGQVGAVALLGQPRQTLELCQSLLQVIRSSAQRPGYEILPFRVRARM